MLRISPLLLHVLIMAAFQTLAPNTCLHGQSIFDPPPDSSRLKIEATRIHTPIRLDGKLDDEAWRDVAESGDFRETWPSPEQKPAIYDTRVKVVYDDRNLYVAAICYNKRGRKELRVQDMRRDFSYAFSESFALTLDPFQDMRNPIPTFLVTPFGTQLDQISYDDRIIDTDWDAVWRVKCSINDSSWVAEIQIPFSSIRYPSNSTQWRINFSRLIRNKSQIVGWSPWPLAFTFGRTTYAGHLNNISAPADNLNLRIQPYGLVSGTRTGDQNVNQDQKLGGEVKWGITPNTLLEGTVNTDFAQADVDRQVINLNRSSVFFPERRQFFLENASLFTVGLNGVFQPFFSRTIGRNDYGQALRINGGMRLVHQDSKKSFGALFIDQEGDTTMGDSRIGMVRAQFNTKNNSRIGAMGIVRQDAATKNTAYNTNSVGILDGFWRANRSLFVRPMLALSHNSSSAKNGAAGMFEMNYTTNHVIASLTETVITSDFESRTGYAARKDFINTSPSVLFTFWGKWLPDYLIYFRPNVQADIFHSSSKTEFQEATFTVSPIFLVFKGYHRASINLIPAWQHLTSPFEPVPGALLTPGNYNYTRYQLSYDGNLSAPYSLSFKLSTGGFYDGDLNSYFVSLRVVPIPHVSCVLNYTRNDFRKVGENKNSFKNELFAPELRLALNANVQLSGFYQYNTAANTGAMNVRFSWQYKPLSYVYLVFNDLRNINSVEPTGAFQQQTGIFKVSYIRQI